MTVFMPTKISDLEQMGYVNILDEDYAKQQQARLRWAQAHMDRMSELEQIRQRQLKRDEKAKEQAMTETTIRPIAIKVANVPDDYARVCKELGFSPAAFEEVEFRNWLFKEEISLYDNKQVMRYLNAKINKSGLDRQRVIWIPLRSKDSQYVHTFAWDGSISNSSTTYEPYQKLVPLRALQIVKKIEDHYKGTGKQPRFFVSEIVDDPDPFLCVKFDGSKNSFIVAVWDEPGFSG